MECEALTIVLATICTLLILFALNDTLWVWIQMCISYLSPYMIPNYEESTLKKFGEWALITGCTDGIGKEYAKELARKGHSIILVSRSLDKLNNVANEIETECAVKTKIIVADFAKGRAVIEHIRNEVGSLPVSILVNNVGTQYTFPMYVGEVPENELWDIINVNIGAVTMLTRTFIEDMRKRGRGAIVNVSSGSEMQPLPLMTVYAASKMYIKSFTEALRFEYKHTNLFIQHILPFFVNTKMNKFSDRLQKNSLFVPNAEMYAKSAVNLLGKVEHSTGYWSHGIQHFFICLSPMWMRIRIGAFLNQSFRKEYLSNNNLKS